LVKKNILNDLTVDRLVEDDVSGGAAALAPKHRHHRVAHVPGGGVDGKRKLSLEKKHCKKGVMNDYLNNFRAKLFFKSHFELNIY
jgi:hypothetical protein